MNILIVSQYAGSEKHGMVYRNYAIAKAWVEMGHQVTIIASSFSASRRVQPKTRGRVTNEDVGGVQYKWMWGPSLYKNTSINRLITMLVYFVQVYFLYKPKGVYDLVVASSPHPFLIYPARKISKKMNAKLIFDIRDLWPMTLVKIGGISPKHPFIRFMQRAEDFACKVSDLVISVPRNCESYLISRGLECGRFLHVGNGAWKSEVEYLPEEHVSVLSEIKNKKGVILAYTGALGIVNAMDVLVNCMSNMPENVHLCIVGDGTCKGALLRQVNDSDLGHRIHFLSPLKKTQISAFLGCVDIAYAGTQKNELYDLGVSLTKMNDYMLAGIPILYSVGDLGNPVELSECGVVCEAENSVQIEKGIKYLVSLSKMERAEKGMKGRVWCERNQMVVKQAKSILVKLNTLSHRSL